MLDVQRAIASLLFVAIFMAVVVVSIVGYVTIQQFVLSPGTPSNQSTTTTSISQGQFFGPPEIAVAFSVADTYLSENPKATLTVANSGGDCTVSYTLFETSPAVGAPPSSQTASYAFASLPLVKAVNMSSRMAKVHPIWTTQFDR